MTADNNKSGKVVKKDEASPASDTYPLPAKISKAEEDALIDSFSKPLHELEDALEQQREDEREVFRQLMQENAQLKRAKEKAEEKLEQAHTKHELLRIDLEAEQKKVGAVEKARKDMEKDMRALVAAGKGKGKGKHSCDDNRDVNPDNMNLEPSDKHAQQIKDLKFRLKRLSEDEAEKDQRIVALEGELSDMRELLLELQNHVDEAKVEELRQKIEERKLATQENNFTEKCNVVTSQGAPPQSALCVIQ